MQLSSACILFLASGLNPRPEEIDPDLVWAQIFSSRESKYVFLFMYDEQRAVIFMVVLNTAS